MWFQDAAGGGGPGDAEVDQDDGAVRLDDEVAGLDVAVDGAVLVSGVQRVGCLGDDRHGLDDRHRALAHPGGERLALHIRHHQVRDLLVGGIVGAGVVVHLDDAWVLTVIHLRLSLVPVLIGLAIAVPLGVLVQRAPIPRKLTTATASVVFTIPSLALFVVLPTVIGTRILDEANVIVALTAYTAALLVRAVIEALDAVPAQVSDAATAVGYPAIKRMLKIELPLSIPILIAARLPSVTKIQLAIPQATPATCATCCLAASCRRG